MPEAQKFASAGLLVLVELPGRILEAALQIRGHINPDKTPDKLKPGEKSFAESWSGACQVTFHGKARPGESPMETLTRKAEHEIGPAGFILDGRELVEVSRLEKPDGLAITYAVRLSPSESLKFIDAIRFHSGSGGLALISRAQLGNVVELKRRHKEDGVQDRNIIAMFPDEIVALRRAFEALG